MPSPAFVRAGRVPYDEAWAWQRRLHERRVAGEIDDTILLLEHPSVYTAGKRTEPAERPTDGTPVVDVDRGGKITWHGPGQLVGYPVLRLPDGLYVVDYVRRLEAALIGICDDLGIDARAAAHRPGPPALVLRGTAVGDSVNSTSAYYGAMALTSAQPSHLALLAMPTVRGPAKASARPGPDLGRRRIGRQPARRLASARVGLRAA